MDTYAVGGSGGPTVINSIFYENTAATNVGAMYVWGGNTGGNCHNVLVNTVFINNHALNGYGGAFISDSQDENGGTTSGSASVTMQNCMLWGNTATSQGQQFFIRGTASQVIAHNSLIDTSASSQPSPHLLAGSSSNILNTTPQFLDIINGRGSDACWLTNDDGLQLTASFPCLDAGENTFNSTSLDILYYPRVGNGTIDIGPYEYQSSTVSVSEGFNIDQAGVVVYPNPTNGQITITGSNSELAEMKVVDTLGRVVNTSIVHINEMSATIDLSTLSKGLYYIKTKTTANKVYKQ
jgi:hypothetical protein